MEKINTKRRTFVKQCVVGGITVYSAPYLFGNEKFKHYENSINLRQDWKSDEQPNFRFDALAKVTGEKIYGRDYRSKDLESWPNEQHYAYMIRTPLANKIYEGLDLSMLKKDSKPIKIITAKNLKEDKIKFPEFFGDKMLLPIGDVPDYQGHELAILIFNNFLSYKKAKDVLHFNDKVIKFGKKVEPSSKTKNPYGAVRAIRKEGIGGSKNRDIYSAKESGLIFPRYKDHKPNWNIKANKKGSKAEKGMYYADELAHDFKVKSKNKDWYVLDKEFTTQSIDPMFLEPETFNVWLDKNKETLHLVITSQSPGNFYDLAAKMLAISPLGKNIKKLIVHSPYIGGGFGGKDHTPFPYYGLVVSMYSKKPVRIANDRYEQFQSGVKRHAFDMKNRLAIDKKTHKIKGFISDMSLDGGGRANFSDSVLMVGVSSIQSVYYFPRSDIKGYVYPSASPQAGSMRGYGTLQTMNTIEMMLSEAAQDLNIDPIEIRRKNLLKPSDKSTQGYVSSMGNRYLEMLDLVAKHDIWLNKDTKKARFEKENIGKKYGVGFGIVTKDYGTSAEAPSSSIEINEDGKIILKIATMEIGTGADTSQGALISRYLGSMADEVKCGEIEEFLALQLFAGDNPFTITQARQDKMSKNPRWTPIIDLASSASQSAMFQTQTTQIAAKILLKHGLFPAAVSIWAKLYSNGTVKEADFNDWTQASWKDGKLTAFGYPPLDLKTLAKQAHKMGLVTSVVAHAFNRWAWAKADFNISGKKESLQLDALAIKYGKGASKDKKRLMNSRGYHLLDRSSMAYPSTKLQNAGQTYYTPCATLVELAIYEGSGKIEILKTHTFLETGHILVKKLVEGQLEGGVAMGIGHALHESLPLDSKGAGDGTWNINRYHAPMAEDVGVWDMEHYLLPERGPSEPSKGLAEVVMIPVVSAIMTGIHHAIGKRFYHLPVTPENIVNGILEKQENKQTAKEEI